MEKYNENNALPVESGMEQAVREPEIYIRPKIRFVLVMAMVPMLLYCAAFAALLMLPSEYAWASGLLLAVLGGTFLLIVWSLLVVQCTSWKLTADQLCFKRGVIARRTDYLELYRVTDYVMKETPVERLLGLCSFYIVSTDSSSPVTRIYGIPHVSGLQAEFRRRVERQRRTKRIIEIGNN